MGTLLFRKVRPDEFDVAHGILVSAADWQGVDRLCLDCVHAKGFLVDFYRGLGFRTIDRRNLRFATGLFDMVLMELKIPKVT
jgi:hypothetical protein